jgi:LmbE family N-acetylglucosaminyl deacetylase
MDDAHQDHRLLGAMAPTVWRDALVLHYEIPKWDGDLGRSNCYVPISPELGQRKVSLLNKHYPSQQSRDWWDDETFFALMRIRGMERRSRYAEAFQTSKAVLSLGAVAGGPTAV